MRKLRLAALILILSLSASCTISVKKANPTAYVKSSQRIEDKLVVYINPSIQNDFEVDSADMKSLHFTQYRESLEAGFTNTFSKIFGEVVFATERPDQGLVLVLDRAAPKHIKSNSVTTSFGNSVGSMPEIKIQIKYDAMLFQNGKEIGASAEQIVSEDVTTTLFGVPAVFENSLSLMFEDMAAKLIPKLDKKAEEIETEPDPETEPAPDESV